MKFTKFTIKNYKGIENITFNLDKSPEANIYTLVGLNESGKTTILEAINSFNFVGKGLGVLEFPGSAAKNYNDLIPISKRDNFNDIISITVETKLEKEDIEAIKKFAKDNIQFKQLQLKDTLIYYNNYHYQNSIFKSYESKWSGFNGIPIDSVDNKFVFISGAVYQEDNLKLADFCRSMIPSILYFPNFLFDFPTKIYLESKDEKPSSKYEFYLELIQDILNSLGNNTNISEHLVARIKSNNSSEKRNLDRMLQLMSIKVTEIIFYAWNKIFKRQINGTRIIITYDTDDTDDNNLPFLEFQIESPDGIYQLNERSLGFRWFFIFLLFTQFRPFRKDTPKNTIFLFDEPASNLHSSAQKQLLKSFENLTAKSKIIYTTHSHHLINPNWLESTYVVKNKGLHLDNPEDYTIKKTNITIESYREFATNHPHNTAYFQPILDVLDYVPSDLENIPNCVFIEGKNDYYTLAYFKDVILKSKFTLNMAPSTGSGNLDTLISLYIGWGKEFIILLDSDTAGKKEKQRYIEKFGLIVEKRLYTLFDVNSSWDNTEIENLFDSSDSLKLQTRSYPSTTSFNKTHFNRSIQESLINKETFDFSEATMNNMSNILDFLSKRIKELI